MYAMKAAPSHGGAARRGQNGRLNLKYTQPHFIRRACRLTLAMDAFEELLNDLDETVAEDVDWGDDDADDAEGQGAVCCTALHAVLHARCIAFCSIPATAFIYAC